MSAARRPAAGAIPPAIDWREGLLLAPQHFQHAAHRAEALLHYHASAASPYHWGLVDFERKPVAGGVLTINRIEAVFPDGLVIAHPRPDGGGPRDLSINLGEHMLEIAEGKDTVFLTTNAREPGDGFKLRYDTYSECVRDETTADDELPVGVLAPRLQLIVADYLRDGLIGFPVARVHVRGGAVEEPEAYTPPWLRVAGGTPIHEVCTRIAERLRREAEDLAASMVHQSDSAKGAQLIETRMLIHSLVSSLPALEVLLRSECAHPFQLYVTLATIAGNLTAGIVPKSVDPYDHENLLRIFLSIERQIEDTIRAAVYSPYTTHAFKVTDDGLGFHLFIQEPWCDRPLMLGVRAPAGVRPADVDKWVAESAIGAEENINDLRRLRRSGVKREQPGQSEVLPSTGDIFYELKAPYAGNLLPRQHLVISNSNREGRPDQVVLYVKQRGTRRVPDEQVS